MTEKYYKFVIGITGSSGIIYAINFIQTLARCVYGESYVIISNSAKIVLQKEMNLSIRTNEELIDYSLKDMKTPIHQFFIENIKNIGARPASGSFVHDGMIIIPCSMKTLSSIANGYSSNLIERSAEVCLKERRRIVVVPRETPLSLIHIENMKKLTQAGGIVLPASPGFYHHPKTIEDLANFISGKILNLFGIEQKVFPSWKG